MPVIKGTLATSGIEENIIYKTLPYNFTALLGIVLVVTSGIFKPYLFNSTSLKNILPKNKEIKKSSLPKNRSKVIAFCFLFCDID